MDARTRINLKAHALGKLREILENGDHKYLLSLSRSDLARALEIEVYFLGLYSAEDTDARTFIHALIQENLDDWHTALTEFVAPLADPH
jgi:hypothetical protein